MRTQDATVKSLDCVQTRNDRNFFLLGNEIKGTQESVRKLKEVVDVRFKQMEFYLINATLFLARTSLECDNVSIRHMQAIRFYVYQMRTLCTHLEAYGSAFFAYKISLFSTISSLAGGYITPQFLLPQQIAEIVKELADDEVTRGTKLSPAIRPSFGAIFYELQFVLEVTLIPRGIFVIWAYQWIRCLQHLIYTMPHRYISPIMTTKKPPCTYSQILFTQYLPITRGLLSLERTRCNSVQGPIESNSAGKDFPQPQMKHSFVWVHPSTIAIFHPSATVKSFQFCCLTVRKPSILRIACIT